MKTVNRYYRRSKLSERKFRQIVRYFAMDFTASDVAQLTGLTRKTVTVIFLRIRERIAAQCEQASPFSESNGAGNEGYCGARRVHDPSGNAIVFGIFKRNGCVYTEVVPDCKRGALQALIRGRVAMNTAIQSDDWRGYDGLVDVAYSKHFRVDYGQDPDRPERGPNHANGIESFWSYAKRRLQKFNGVPGGTFYLHLKECEYRFNNRPTDLSRELLRLLLRYPL